jgi:hypothetical protein
MIRFRVVPVAAVGALALVAMTGCSSSSSSPDTATDSGAADTATDAPLGPGAAYLCTSSGKDAWETYGATAFVAVNESIFTNVTNVIADSGTSELGTSLTLVGSGNPPSTVDSLATFKGKLAAFLVYAYGGPTSIMYTDGKTYSGLQDMTAAHTGLSITSDQYTYFVTNVIVPALTSNGVPSGDISSCFAPVITDSAFEASIVGH